MADVKNPQEKPGAPHSDFDRLLKLFHQDPSMAAEQYEIMRMKLRAYFRWRGGEDPDALVDEAMDRVLRRLSDGAIIHSPSSYFYSVARHLLREEGEKNSRLRHALQNDPRVKLEHNPVLEDAEKEEAATAELRLTCLKSCLRKLPAAEKALILQYYRFGKEGKSHRRKELADARGIPLNALRIRVFRIRARLGTCIQKCLGTASGMKWESENDSID